MKLLEGKVAIITGATRGIGKGVAEVFAKNGADIAFTYVSSDEKAKAIEENLKSFGVKVKSYKFNVAEYAATEEFIADVASEFGKIDVIVNNAGITRDGLLMRMSEENWDDVMNINLKSVFNVTKCALRTLLKQRFGSIINMSSVVGIEGNGGQSNYAASKAGVIGFTKSIAQEIGSRNIRCNAICPGFIETEMTKDLDPEVIKGWVDDIPMKRSGTPEDVANAALFLASDLSNYVNGQTLNVCGGIQT
ncbi:MAG: 3-oxoacyl-[acyl-carrier-protein] reductase [Flavobacteriales bacterium]|nr:MAG: 3-oxoacyl-[acyl-carrier-protein] reductase [Flavobacteriales bacterium]